MNEKNGIGESKPKQSRRQGESTPEMPVGRAHVVESLAVGKVLVRLTSIRVAEKLCFHASHVYTGCVK